jgi:hypothetical protein
LILLVCMLGVSAFDGQRLEAQSSSPDVAGQTVEGDAHAKGPNPWLDVTRYGGYLGPNATGPATTGSIAKGSKTLKVAESSDFANGHGILVLGAGPAPVIATPQTPAVTPIAQTGASSYSYCVADRDWAGGITPCSPAGTTSAGFRSMTLQSYTISQWSRDGGVVTITTSAPHNIPRTPYVANSPFPQVEVKQSSTNNRQCEGAFSLTAVPSATTMQFTQYAAPDSTVCAGGALRVLPKIVLKWDSHYTYQVQSASCSAGIAKVRVSPGVYGPTTSAASTWVVPWGDMAVLREIADSHFDGTFVVGKYSPSGTSPDSVTFDLGTKGSCEGIKNAGAGGTMALVPGKAVKNHLVYRCTGAGCGLPANAAKYLLVGVATGNDGYFVDNGWGVTAGQIDTGDAPATAPTMAKNEYLDTTIDGGGGTTSLSLGKAAEHGVVGAKVFHDNTPNLLAACAALSADAGGANGGHIVIPASTGLYNYFPIVGNFDMNGNFGQNPRNCPWNTTVDFRDTVFQRGAILLGNGDNLISGQGSTNCLAPFYQMGGSLTCIRGTSYPMFYFEPETSGSNYLENLVVEAEQNYQSAFYYDAQMNSDGVVSQRYDNTHAGGSGFSYPIVDKGGFGRFWNMGGWSARATNFSNGIDYQITLNCGMPGFARGGSGSMVYIFNTNMTYSFGTFQVDNCGIATGIFGNNVYFHQMLTEGAAGPAFKFNLWPYGLSGITFDQGSYSDFTGGAATPYFDVTNATVSGAEINYMICATGQQPLLQTGTNEKLYSGILVKGAQGGCTVGIGALSGYRFDNLSRGTTVVSGYNTALTNGSRILAGQIATPAKAPDVSIVTGDACKGFPPVGTYTYGITALDITAPEGPASGTDETLIGPPSESVKLNGTTQCAQITMPSMPSGAAYWYVYRLSGPGSVARIANNGATGLVPITTRTVHDGSVSTSGVTGPPVNSSYLNVASSSGFSGAISASTITTQANCKSTSSPANCGTAPAGLVRMAATQTTLVIHTSAVTGNSRFSFTYVTAGSGCSPAPGNISSLLPPYVSGISAGNNFTITLPVAPATNPVCISYEIID